MDKEAIQNTINRYEQAIPNMKTSAKKGLQMEVAKLKQILAEMK